MASRPLPPARRRSSRPKHRNSENLDLPEVKTLEATDSTSSLVNNVVFTDSLSLEKVPTSILITSTNALSNDIIGKSYANDDSNSAHSFEESSDHRTNQDGEVSQENLCYDALKGGKSLNEENPGYTVQSPNDGWSETCAMPSNEELVLISEEPKQASLERKTESIYTPVKASIQVEFHPLSIVLPVKALSQIPNDVTCLYDAAAVEMQRMILKAVKKFFRKDKIQVDEFKINARLYGNNFMGCNEYFDSLVKGFGPVRALQLAPCLVCIQPDGTKRMSLLQAARLYALKNRNKLQQELEKLMEEAEDPAEMFSYPVTPPRPEITTIPQRDIVTGTTLNVFEDRKDAVDHQTSSVPVESSTSSIARSTEEMQLVELESSIDREIPDNIIAVPGTMINDVLEPTIEQIPPASDLVVEDFNPEIALQNRSVPDPNIREQEKNVTVDPSSSECTNVAESLKIKRTDIAASVSTQSTITDTTAASTQESSVIPPQMLFGFATAADDESDSESSEFSE